MSELGTFAPAAEREVHPLLWSVRRELWENRFIYIAPAIVTLIVLVATMITVLTLPSRLNTMAEAKHLGAIITPYSMAPAPIMLASFIIGAFYALDALYGERRDRSLLFWKSMPVSDKTSVVAKALIPMAVLPLIALGLGIFAQKILQLLSTVVLSMNGYSAAPFWSLEKLVGDPLIELYGLTVHALWFAPIYCWLLLVSAWAKRVPLLWAVLPLFGPLAFEGIVFKTSHFGKFITWRLNGAMKTAFAVQGDIKFAELTPLRFLLTPGLWLGLAFGAGCIAIAIRLRRNRDPV